LKGEWQDRHKSDWMRAEFSLLVALLFFVLAASVEKAWG